MPPTTEKPFSFPLLRALPFVALGALGLAYFFGPGAGSSGGGSDGSGVALGRSGDDSVKVSAALERGALYEDRVQSVFARVQLDADADAAPEETPPLALTLLIDTSGSMSGDKIISARESAAAILDQLRPQDRASVVEFSSGARVLASRVSSQAGLAEARARVLALSASGGTDMVSGLGEASAEALRIHRPNGLSRVLLLSDGQPDTERGLVDQVEALARDEILTTTLGLGRDYNEDLMARLADAGLGNYYFVESASQMQSVFAAEVKALQAVGARGVEVSLAPGPGVVVEQVVGYPSSLAGGRTVVPVGALYAKKKADLLVRLRVDTSVADADRILDVATRWTAADSDRTGQDERRIAATFTDDDQQIERSAVPEVVAKAERVRAADALEQATEAYASGRKDEARRIITSTKQKLNAYQAQAKGAYKQKAAKLMGDLDGLAAEAEAPAADMKVLKKRAKAQSRAMKKH